MRVRHLLFILLLGVISCHDKQPDNVLSESKMTDVLYDYHIAQGLTGTVSDSSAKKYLTYRQAIYAKHGIDQKTFEESMAYYTRHSEGLLRIYQKLSERLNAETFNTGIALNENESNAVNLWAGRSFYVLSAKGENRISHKIKADSTWQQTGGSLNWTFSVSWVYKEGERNALALAVIEYGNDSTSVISRQIYSSGKQEVNITLPEEPDVKSVTLHFYQNTTWAQQARLLVVDNMSLVFIPKKKEENKQEELSEPGPEEKNVEGNTEPLQRVDSAQRHPNTEISTGHTANEPMPKPVMRANNGNRPLRQIQTSQKELK